MATRERGPAAAVATEEPREADAPVYHLQLRPRPHVTFDESVVDNEHLGRKKSNSASPSIVWASCEQQVAVRLTLTASDLCMRVECCIFHKKREFGESSSESGEDDSDDERGHHHDHDHHGHGCAHKKRPRRRPRPKRSVSPSSSDDEQKAAA